MDSLTAAMTTTQTPPSRSVPTREDCWSEDATATLVDAWGRRYVELNRGNLRQKDWQEVADTVNALHGHSKKTHRTDVQCKNRIDTLKKKYKIEKAKIIESNGALTSSWPFFSRLDELIGSSYNKLQKVSPLASNSCSKSNSSPLGLGLNSSPLGLGSNSPPMAVPLPYRKLPPPFALPAPPLPAATPHVKLQPVVLAQKRPSSAIDDSYFKRNYSAMAAAAAKPAVEEEEERGESSEEIGNETESEDSKGEEEGMRRLAKAIERFGEIYERVEEMKQRQMVDLEKQRMQFAKDLEVQRMQLFMDTQVQLEKLKRAKRSGSDGIEFQHPFSKLLV